MALCPAYCLYGTYVLDFRLNGTLCAGIMRPECRQFKCMELTKPYGIDQLHETEVYNARQAVLRPLHQLHLEERKPKLIS